MDRQVHSTFRVLKYGCQRIRNDPSTKHPFEKRHLLSYFSQNSIDFDSVTEHSSDNSFLKIADGMEIDETLQEQFDPNEQSSFSIIERTVM